MKKNNVVGTNIRNRRLELGLTQTDLAKRMEYKSKSTINKVESGINDVNQTTLAKYAVALLTTPERLMGWVNPKDELTSTSTPLKVMSNNESFMNGIGKEIMRDRVNDLVLEKLDNTPLSYDEIELVKKYRSLRTSERNELKAALDTLTEKSDLAKELENKVVEFAYYGKVAAAGTFINSFYDLMKRTVKVQPDHNTNKADYCIGVSGDSMEPAYSDGDVVLVKAINHVQVGEVGIFQRDNDIYIKQYTLDGLKSFKEGYETVIGDDIKCLGRVLGKAVVE